MHFLIKGVVSVIIVLLISATGVNAQRVNGSLRIQVLDPNGALVPNAKVTITDAAGTEKAAGLNGNEFYIITELAPGRYTVVTAGPGFRTDKKENVEVTAGRATTLKVTLEIEEVRQEVSTSADARRVSTDPDTSANTIVLKGSDLDALPDDTEEFAAALQVLAGPSAGPAGSQFIVDGFTRGTVPNKQSIREVRINQNPYSTEYDSLGFGRVEIFTRPGSNQVHGQGFFNFSDESLNSRNPFAPNRAPFQTRLFGGNVSGPLVKSRSSYFLDVERRELDENALVNATVLDPLFNVEPFILTVLTPQRRTSFSVRADYQLNKNNTATARYAFLRTGLDNAGVGNFSLPSRAFSTSNTTHTLQLTETAVLGATAVNVARFQFIHAARDVDGNNTIPTTNVLESFVGGGAQVGQASNTDNRFEFQDYLLKVLNKHSLKFGGRARYVSVIDTSPTNFGGTFTFAGGNAPLLDANNQIVIDPATGLPVITTITSIERFRRTSVFLAQNLSPAEIRIRGGGATQFSIAAGNPKESVSQFDVGLFVQDDWRVRPNLTLSGGLRYETQTNINSNLNFAPRVAFAWMPLSKGKARGNTVLRGGFGIFYDRVEENLTLRARRFNGLNQQNFIVTNPDFYPVVPPVSALSNIQQLQTTRPLAGNLEAPYTMNYSIGVEHQFPRETSLAVSYIGTRTLHGLRSRNVNAPLPGTFIPGIPGSGVRPFGNVGDIYLVESSARLNQQQLIVNVNTSFDRRVTLFSTYVLGKVDNDALDFTIFPANSYDLRSEYGRSALDIRHRFTLGGTIRAPWGLVFNPFVVALSSRPFNITTGQDTNGDDVFAERPALATDLTKPGVIVTRFGAFDPNPAPGQAIIARNFGLAPSYFTVNLRVSKVLRFGDMPGTATAPARPAAAGNAAQRAGAAATPAPRPNTAAQAEKRYSLSFGVQVQNLFNKTNLATPVGNLSSPFFGQSLSINGGIGFGGGGSASAANRRVEAQIRFTF
ncbi:MAG TPA: carboxypeptidase regulatory-like domain-containing protein [Pyrinomonadaceae bacterium]|nr:carboxypeptidase regulatory-like domain-containing protein [Pyrinomonadaceae bacterium]